MCPDRNIKEWLTRRMRFGAFIEEACEWSSQLVFHLLKMNSVCWKITLLSISYVILRFWCRYNYFYTSQLKVHIYLIFFLELGLIIAFKVCFTCTCLVTSIILQTIASYNIFISAKFKKLLMIYCSWPWSLNIDIWYLHHWYHACFLHLTRCLRVFCDAFTAVARSAIGLWFKQPVFSSTEIPKY